MNMKKPFTYFLAIVILAIATIACKKKEKVKLPKGEEEVVVPCSGPQYFTDKKTFRANAMGRKRLSYLARGRSILLIKKLFVPMQWVKAKTRW